MQTVQKLQKGFTLIELMIVVAIIGILAAVALPAYQDYVAKSKNTSVVATMAGLKTSVFDYYTAKGQMPLVADFADDKDMESSYQTINSIKNVEDVVAADFTRAADKLEIAVTLQNVNGVINGEQIVFTYEESNSTLLFSCVAEDSTTLKNKYLPNECQTVAAVVVP